MAEPRKAKASAPIHAHQEAVRDWKDGGMVGPRPAGDPYATARKAAKKADK